MRLEELFGAIIFLVTITFVPLVVMPCIGWIMVKALVLTTLIEQPCLGYWSYLLIGFAITIITGGLSISLGGK